MSKNGAAFPQSGFEQWQSMPGMTLRDYFAAKALQSLVASVGQHSVGLGGGSAMYGTPEIHAKSAYTYADAMLAAREVAK